jgi:hypothetical protein
MVRGISVMAKTWEAGLRPNCEAMIDTGLGSIKWTPIQAALMLSGRINISVS